MGDRVGVCELATSRTYRAGAPCPASASQVHSPATPSAVEQYMTKLRLALLGCVLALSVACAKAPPSLSPVGVRAWHANEAVVALGTLQHSVIQLNAIKVCDGPVSAEGQATCHPMVSDRNTRIVVDAVTAGVKVIQEAPDGWRAITSAVLDQIGAELDTFGQSKLRIYIEAARVVLLAIPTDAPPKGALARVLPFGGR